MANEAIKILIEGVDNASDEIKKVNKEAKKLNETTKKAQTGAEKYKQKMDGLKKGMLAVGVAMGTVAAAGMALKKAYDFAKQGAAIRQQTESFEGLLAQLNVAPGYLDKLRDASRGTIDDMSLMASTVTLVAGAGDELAKSMLDAAPRLLEIAKAANKLNPTLGTTKFMFESLMLGIKRGSKLIIDNTGVTFDLSTAYSEYAASIGKSVESMTDADQKMAILEATMERGSKIIEQVGGNVDSAVDSFAQLETATNNLANAWKSGISVGGGFATVVDRLNLATSKLIAGQALQQAISEGTITGVRGAEMWADAIGGMAPHLLDVGEQYEAIADLMTEINKLEKEHADYLKRTEMEWARVNSEAVQMGEWERQLSVVRKSWDYYTRKANEAANATETWGVMARVTVDHLLALEEGQKDASAAMERVDTDHIEGYAREWDSVASSAGDAAAAVGGYFDNLNTGIASVLQTKLEQLQFEALGGAEIVIAEADVTAALEARAISPEQAASFYSELYGAAADIQTEMDKLDASGATTEFGALEEPLEAAKLKVGEVQTALDAMTGKSYYVNVVVSGLGAWDWKEKPTQTGGVAAKGDVHLVGERGPELFVPHTSGKIIPNNEMSSVTGGGMTVNVYAAAGMNEEALAHAVITKINEAQRRAGVSGTAYVGH